MHWTLNLKKVAEHENEREACRLKKKPQPTNDLFNCSRNLELMNKKHKVKTKKTRR